MVSYAEWELRVHEIKGKMDRGELIPDPEWQRGYIWSRKDEELLIDSIVKGVPIPKFYLTEEYDVKKGVSIHYAVDGQQRLKAIYKFLNNEFTIDIGGSHYLFKDLTSPKQQAITTYKLNGHYLQNYDQGDINFLFQRLNRTGIKLTNMEEWNNEYYKTNVLGMVKEIREDNQSYYQDMVYTEENVKRMLPLDDIIDVCNCLKKDKIESGSKGELSGFLNNYKNISTAESSKLKSKFRKTINNLKQIITTADLRSCQYSTRTHFISLYLSIGLMISECYILRDVDKLKNDLLDFIENQPKKYKESVMGGIRQKDRRQTRVRMLQKIILKYSMKLDSKRFFDETLKQQLWRHSKPKHLCKICGKGIGSYENAVVDHIQPWAKAGRTVQTNAQLAHKKCNQKKRDSVEQFIIVKD